MTKYKYLGNYPSNDGSDWCDSLQGVAHNREHWIFTQKTRILKFHISQDLKTAELRHAVVTMMPAKLKGMGCNHFGDPDYHMLGDKGYLFIPVEGTGECGEKPRLAVFVDDGAGSKFKFVDETSLPSQVGSYGTGRAGWCAFAPETQVLYSSDNEIALGLPVFGYKVDFDELVDSGRLSLKAARNLHLKGFDGETLAIKPYMQGGTFTPDGRLHLLSGRLFEDPERGGIWVFDNAGKLQKRSSRKKASAASRSAGADFQFAFDSGWRRRQEPEGLTYWNTDTPELRAIRHRKVSGQLHAILLNKKFGDDHMWLKHYRMSPVPQEA